MATNESSGAKIFKAAMNIRDKFISAWGAVFDSDAQAKPKTVFYPENRIIDFVLVALDNYVREDRYEFFRDYYLARQIQ